MLIASEDLDALRRYLDELFHQAGLDIEFSHHFFDRVNDARNGKQIEIKELSAIFKEVYAKYHELLHKEPRDWEALIRDTTTKINIPFILQYDKDTGYMELVAKTVMRTPRFLTRDRQLVVTTRPESVEVELSERTGDRVPLGTARSLWDRIVAFINHNENFRASLKLAARQSTQDGRSHDVFLATGFFAGGVPDVPTIRFSVGPVSDYSSKYSYEEHTITFSIRPYEAESILEALDGLYQDFVHEFTHAFDTDRIAMSRGSHTMYSVARKAKGTYHDYVNNPLELNAHYLAAVGTLLHRSDSARRYGDPRTGFEAFKTDFLEMYVGDLRGIDYWKPITPENQKRLLKRLYTSWSEAFPKTRNESVVVELVNSQRAIDEVHGKLYTPGDPVEVTHTSEPDGGGRMEAHNGKRKVGTLRYVMRGQVPEITTIEVEPEWKHRGVGHALYRVFNDHYNKAFLPKESVDEIAIPQYEFKNFRFRNDVTDYYSNQTNGVLFALDGDTPLGALEWSFYKEHYSVQMLTVAEPYRRRGVGSALIRELRRIASEEPDASTHIHYGYSTPDGTKMLAALKAGEYRQYPRGAVPVAEDVSGRDADSIEKHARQLGYTTKRHSAQTGTVYITADHEKLKTPLKIRVADHADAYGTADYTADDVEGSVRGARDFLGQQIGMSAEQVRDHLNKLRTDRRDRSAASADRTVADLLKHNSDDDVRKWLTDRKNNIKWATNAADRKKQESDYRRHVDAYRKHTGNTVEAAVEVVLGESATYYHGGASVEPNPLGVIWLTTSRVAATEYAKQYGNRSPRLWEVRLKSAARIIDLRDINNPITHEVYEKVSAIRKYTFGAISPERWVEMADFGILEGYSWMVRFLRSRRVDAVRLHDTIGTVNVPHEALAVLNPSCIEMSRATDIGKQPTYTIGQLQDLLSKEPVGEAHLDITAATYPEDLPFKRISDTDTVTVYHGFRDFGDAWRAVRYGLSGQDRVSRVYSYEANNNPKGLFVTPDRKKAEDFVGAVGIAVVMEFDAKVSELEAPVWPGGSYTVQGQMAQYWHGKADRFQGTLRARADAKKSTIPVVSGSDRPEVAAWLAGATGERQALFVGHLAPSRIKALWVRRPRADGYQYNGEPWTKMSVAELLKEFPAPGGGGSGRVRFDNRMFGPDDDFDAELFVKRLSDRFKMSRADIIDVLLSALGTGGGPHRYSIAAEDYLWPKQLPAYLRWIKSIRHKPVESVDVVLESTPPAWSDLSRALLSVGLRADAYIDTTTRYAGKYGDDINYALGHAGYAEGPNIKIIHVTDNPNRLREQLRSTQDFKNTYGKGRYPELGPGLYGSDMPQIWVSRSSNKYDFLKNIQPAQLKSLVAAIREHPNLAGRGYITSSERESAERILKQAEDTNDADVLTLLADQPYNVRFWEPEFLEKIGIRPGTQPAQLTVTVSGKFADLTEYKYTTLRGSDLAHLLAAGFDGAFCRNSFSKTAQFVVWRRRAVVGVEESELSTSHNLDERTGDLSVRDAATALLDKMREALRRLAVLTPTERRGRIKKVGRVPELLLSQKDYAPDDPKAPAIRLRFIEGGSVRATFDYGTNEIAIVMGRRVDEFMSDPLAALDLAEPHLRHELTHYYDFQRIPADAWERQHARSVVDRNSYINDPNEMNARFQEYLTFCINDAKRFGKDFSGPGGFDRFKQSFMSRLVPFGIGNNWKLLTPDNKERLLKRLYSAWQSWNEGQQKLGASESVEIELIERVSDSATLNAADRFYKYIEDYFTKWARRPRGYRESVVVGRPPQIYLRREDYAPRDRDMPSSITFIFRDGGGFDSERKAFFRPEDRNITVYLGAHTEPMFIDRPLATLQSVRGVLTHEFTHFYDHSRVGRSWPSVATSGGVGVHGYVNNTTEQNARFMDTLRELSSRVEEYRGRDGLNRFIDDFRNGITHNGRLAHFWDELTPENQRRLVARIVSAWQDLAGTVTTP